MGAEVEVCAKCHEKDRQVTKCNVPLIHHIKWSRGFVGYCDICGKAVEATYCCVAYKKLLEKVALEEYDVRL